MFEILVLFVDLGLLMEEGVRHARHLHHHAVVVMDNSFVLVEQDVAEVRDRQLDLYALEHPAAMDNVGKSLDEELPVVFGLVQVDVNLGYEQDNSSVRKE